MSVLETIKTTLTNDLHVAEADAHQLATKILGAAEQTFAGILEHVLQTVKSRPIGEILEGVYGIYKELHAQAPPAAAAPDAPAT